MGIDQRTSRRFATLATNKQSNNRATIEQITLCLRRMGHRGSVEIQIDGEPSLVELMTSVAAQRDVPTLLRRSPAYDSQANGRVERCVRSIEEISRTLKLDLEQRIRKTISVKDEIFGWMLRHGVMVLDWRQVGYDGRTAHERALGRPYRGELFPFACLMMFKNHNKPDGGEMSSRWSRGLWLGKTVDTDEHVLWRLDGGGVSTARSVAECRLPDRCGGVMRP